MCAYIFTLAQKHHTFLQDEWHIQAGMQRQGLSASILRVTTQLITPPPVAPTPTISSISTTSRDNISQSPQSQSASSSSVDIGAIVGGVCGGVAGLFLIIFSVWCYIKTTKVRADKSICCLLTWLPVFHS
jgi:hypothetical protein